MTNQTNCLQTSHRLTTSSLLVRYRCWRHDYCDGVRFIYYLYVFVFVERASGRWRHFLFVSFWKTFNSNYWAIAFRCWMFIYYSLVSIVARIRRYVAIFDLPRSTIHPVSKDDNRDQVAGKNSNRVPRSAASTDLPALIICILAGWLAIWNVSALYSARNAMEGWMRRRD